MAYEQEAWVLVVTHDHRTLDVFARTREMEDGRLQGVSPPADDEREAG